MEKQPVGECSTCGKVVYCDGGFLEGIVLADHSMRCFDCEDQTEREKRVN